MSTVDATESPLLAVNGLSVDFTLKTGLFGRATLRAVRDVSFSLAAGETLGIVGESGSGKSTTGRSILRLVEPTAGTVIFDGVDLASLSQRAVRSHRSRMQMVFQDPNSSLDPSMTIAESLSEPLRVHTDMSAKERRRTAGELLDMVRLSRRQLDRYPYEFSGGQRQRIAIARAIALRPKLVILDEAVSALDVSTQNEIINLLKELQAELGMSYLFIAHDLAVVEHLAARVAVMYLGQIVEIGETAEVFENPRHPYTESLLSAVPRPAVRTDRSRTRIILRGETPDPSAAPSGCSFHPRCHYAISVCAQDDPDGFVAPGGTVSRCHLHRHGPELQGRPLAAIRNGDNQQVHPTPVTEETS